ncbi:MAG: DNA-primase RepB domain-containing protein [Edaphobacter sp.]
MPRCTDCNRVLRVPGFLNRKYDPAHRVTVEYPDDSIWTPDDFRLDAGVVDAMLFGDAIASENHHPSTAIRRVIGHGFP